MFGLAGIAAVAAMAFVGATSAMATSTVLCDEHVEAKCPAGHELASVHAVNTAGTVGILLNSTADVLCLNVLVQAASLGLAAPLQLHPSVFSITGCGTTSAHNNCTVTVENTAELPLPLFLLLRTALNVGTLSVDGGFTRVKCTIGGFIKIDCTYSGNELSFSAAGAGGTNGNGMLTASNSPASLVKGNGLCPETSSLDGLLEPLVATYILE
jgi:hypothetical protein